MLSAALLTSRLAFLFALKPLLAIAGLLARSFAFLLAWLLYDVLFLWALLLAHLFTLVLWFLLAHLFADPLAWLSGLLYGLFALFGGASRLLGGAAFAVILGLFFLLARLRWLVVLLDDLSGGLATRTVAISVSVSVN